MEAILLAFLPQRKALAYSLAIAGFAFQTQLFLSAQAGSVSFTIKASIDSSLQVWSTCALSKTRGFSKRSSIGPIIRVHEAASPPKTIPHSRLSAAAWRSAYNP